MPKAPLVTLTTDFGLSDHYAGVMKGVIFSICPQATIVDISHDVSAYEISEAAYTVAQAYRWFPKKTVHVVVIDPGVGTSRRPILVQAAGQYFVAPDNGVLSMIYSREKHAVRVISAERYFLKPLSQTFHGRDIFAPVAARVAAGLPASQLGKIIQDYLRLTFEKPEQTGKRMWSGRILKIDRFGNMITNFSTADFPNLATGNFEMALGPHHVTVLALNYTETSPGELFLIAGSGGHLEVSARQASAAKISGCAVGAPADLTIW
jgi:S-adenosylmethionine hydrolase